MPVNDIEDFYHGCHVYLTQISHSSPKVKSPTNLSKKINISGCENWLYGVKKQGIFKWNGLWLRNRLNWSHTALEGKLYYGPLLIKRRSVCHATVTKLHHRWDCMYTPILAFKGEQRSTVDSLKKMTETLRVIKREAKRGWCYYFSQIALHVTAVLRGDRN